MPEIYSPQEISWEIIKDEILNIEQQNFREKSFTEQDFQHDFNNLSNTIVLLRDTKTNKIIGYTYAIHGSLKNEQKIYKTDTAYINSTAILPEYQKHHLVGKMMQQLEETLKIKGYKYVERDAVVANNYAANIKKNYQDRIVEEGTPHYSEWGQQIHFKIQL